MCALIWQGSYIIVLIVFFSVYRDTTFFLTGKKTFFLFTWTRWLFLLRWLQSVLMIQLNNTWTGDSKLFFYALLCFFPRILCHGCIEFSLQWCSALCLSGCAALCCFYLWTHPCEASAEIWPTFACASSDWAGYKLQSYRREADLKMNLWEIQAVCRNEALHICIHLQIHWYKCISVKKYCLTTKSVTCISPKKSVRCIVHLLS